MTVDVTWTWMTRDFYLSPMTWNLTQTSLEWFETWPEICSDTLETTTCPELLSLELGLLFVPNDLKLDLDLSQITWNPTSTRVQWLEARTWGLTCPTSAPVSSALYPLLLAHGAACPALSAVSGSPSWGWSSCISSRARWRRPPSSSHRSSGRRGRVWRTDSFPSHSAPAVYLHIQESSNQGTATIHSFSYF